MKNYIRCYDEEGKLIGRYDAPFDVKVDCYYVEVYGEDFSGMMLRGKCNWLVILDSTYNYNKVDLSGFMDLEIGEIVVGNEDKGLLKLLELKCEGIYCDDKKLENIVNKYLLEEDPLMRDIQGCKYELAINGYGDRL